MKEYKEIKGEEWKPIENTNYYISNMGRVKGPRGLVKPQPNKRTKLNQCMIYIDKKPKLLNVCQWVARVFLGEPPFEGAVARHINRKLHDDRVENIEWGKQGGLPRAKHPRYRYVIKQKTINGLVIGQFVGWDFLALNGYKRCSIVAAAHGKYRGNLSVYKNFKWEVIKVRNDEV